MSWEEDSFAPFFRNRQIFFVSEDYCTLLTSPDGVTVESQVQQCLSSSQEEADGQIILHCFFAAQTCDEILVKSPDTDVFLLLLHFAKQIQKPLYFETGYGVHHKIINMTALSDKRELERDAILGFHAFTGCDTTSAFLRRGKVKPLNLMRKNQLYRDIFETLGTKATVDPHVFSELEKFVCSMYGKHKYTDVNKLRCDMVNQRFCPGSSGALVTNFDGVDLSLIPPCRSVLRMHIKRVNYQVLLWKKSFMPHPNLPPPEAHGWKQSDEDGQLEFDWCEGSIMPNELVDIASSEQTEDQDDEVETTEDDISESLFDELYQSEESDDDDN